jgi:DNA-binding CsgD family transcriptional regulator
LTEPAAPSTATAESSPRTPAHVLFGREREVSRLRGLIDGVEQRGAAAMLRGEPGIGKTALLAEARRLGVQRGMRVLATTGTHAEVDVPFACLHQLLRPLRTELDALGASQRDVLLAAFGTEVAAPQLYAIARAVLDLLSEAAREGPILIAVEDAHWLDRCTTDVLAFVARRLESDRVVLLAASPAGFESTLDEAGPAYLELSPLDDESAGELLDAHAPDLPPALRQRLLTEAAGNPLALVELPIAAARIDTGALIPTWLPLTTRLEQAFAARVSELPVATRTLLLIAALNDRDDLVEALGSASLLAGQAVTLDDLSPAVQARLIEADDNALRFRHSLMRSAIRQAASLSRRHAGHAALAETLADQPRRRVWHRAASIVGTDDSLADELEAMAGRAQTQGNFADAVSSLERAAWLSSSRYQRGIRLLRAAELAFELGRRDVVARLLAADEISELSAHGRARVMFISENLEDSVPGVPKETLAVADAAESAAERGDTDLALNLLAAAGTRSWWGDLEEQIGERLAEVALRVKVDQSDPRLLASVAWAAPVNHASLVAKRLTHIHDLDSTDPARAHLCGMAATAIGHFELSATFFERAVDGLRSQGRLALLAQALTMRAWSGIRLGTWTPAAQDAEEAALMAHRTRQPSLAARAIAAEAMLAALRGDNDLAETLAQDGERKAAPAHAPAALFDIQSARCLAALGAGRYTDAFDSLRCVIDPTDPAYHATKRLWVIGDLADAAAHSGNRDTVLALMPDIETVCQRTPSPDIHVALRHARAVLADDDHCEPLYRSALDSDPSPPFDQARLHLAFGAWLRRQRRVGESRSHLRQARDELEALGASQWAERADRELRATGETSKRRRPDARDEMTPQEWQIAEMAANGLSNREIGQRLYLSHRTVGSHLYRVFPKLGVRARNELRAALNDAHTQRPPLTSGN